MLPSEMFRCDMCVSSWGTPREKFAEGQHAEVLEKLGKRLQGLVNLRDTGNIPAAAGGNSSLLSWLRSVDGLKSADFPVAIQPVTPKYFPPSGDKRKEGGLALVKCGADSFTASLGRGAERMSVRFNLC